MARHYHVTSGLGGGYMPNNVEFHTSRRSAEDSARETVRRFRDDGSHWPGNARTGGYTRTLRDKYDLGEYVSVDSCQDDCTNEDDSYDRY